MACPTHLHFFFPIPSALLRYLLLLLFALPPSLLLLPPLSYFLGGGGGRGREKREGQKRDPFPPLGFGRHWTRKKGGEKREIVFLAFSSFSSPSPPPNYPCAVASQVPPMLPLCSVHRNTVFPPKKKRGEEIIKRTVRGRKRGPLLFCCIDKGRKRKIFLFLLGPPARPNPKPRPESSHKKREGEGREGTVWEYLTF